MRSEVSEADVKNGIELKRNVYCNDGIHKVYLHLNGTTIETIF